MIRNYFKIAFRNLSKNKGYSFLNIFGLAIGITCASLILLWVEDEMSFNASFEKQNQVFYVPTNQLYDGEWRTFYSTPGPLAEDMKNTIPEIVKAATTKPQYVTLKVGEKSINRIGNYTDVDIFDIFSLSFIEGNLSNAFKNPESIVLTQETAVLLFGEQSSYLGNTVRVNNHRNHTVTAIIEDLPENVTFNFGWLAPMEIFIDGAEWASGYESNFADTFVELAPGASVEATNAKVKKIIPEKLGDGETYAFLHSMKDWYLRSKFKDGKIVGGRITYVRLFAIIASIILLIACINFMNLSTARSEKRANEVGVRKAIGSTRSSLISQFLIEAIVISVIATVVSVGLLLILLPQFNVLIGKNLSLGLDNPFHLIALATITLVCGFLAGMYPAFYLSSFRPVSVLKGIKATKASVLFIRKGLVVGQFTISIVFIIGTILVYQQIQHVKNRDLGYDKDMLITMKADGDMINNFSVIQQELVNSGVVLNSALSNSSVLADGNNRSGLEWKGGINTGDILISMRHVSSDFFATTGMKIIEGRGFKQNPTIDSTNILISESLAKLMGEGSAIGKTIRAEEDAYEVVGIVRDYLYGDMYGTSDPVIFFNTHAYASYLYIKADTASPITDVLSKIEAVMKKNNPAFPFEYEFVDERFNSMFKSEQLISKLSQIFALLAIFISCLGLFGLAAYTAEQRRKEIGIRKVLGASVSGIVKLLSKDFLKLIVISFLIAFPLGYYLMSQWLQGYAYRIDIHWSIFILAAIITLFIALTTISWQSIKAATINPAKSLRTE